MFLVLYFFWSFLFLVTFGSGRRVVLINFGVFFLFLAFILRFALLGRSIGLLGVIFDSLAEHHFWV